MLRFAPSKNIDMNIDNLRIALLNHIISKQNGENLIIRLESEDKKILDILTLFAIDYSQILIQGDNIKYHQQIAMQLLMKKKAFNCFCGDTALENDAQELKEQNKPYRYSGFCENLSDETTINCEAPFTVRIKKPITKLSFTDPLKEEIDSFIVLNKDKKPTYDFACAVDDMISDISIVIENEEHISSAPKQIHIRNQIGYDKKIDYIHLPKINTEEGSLSIKRLIEEGYIPASIANYLILLSYPTSPKEIFTIEEAVQWLDINQVSKLPITFNIDKLNLINTQYIEALEDMRLSKLLGYADTDIGKLAKIYLKEANTIKELKVKINNFFMQKITLKNFEEEFKTIKLCLQKAPFIKEFTDLNLYIIKHTGLKDTRLLKPLRYILTGATIGPDLDALYPYIRNYLGEIIK